MMMLCKCFLQKRGWDEAATIRGLGVGGRRVMEWGGVEWSRKGLREIEGVLEGLRRVKDCQEGKML